MQHNYRPIYALTSLKSSEVSTTTGQRSWIIWCPWLGFWVGFYKFRDYDYHGTGQLWVKVSLRASAQ